MLDLKITPQRNALLKGFDNEFHALLQVNAVEHEGPEKRTKTLNLAIVIDRSGSMSGQPLEEAKRSAIMMIEQMNVSDRVAVVAYDNEAELIVPSMLCMEKATIIDGVRSIREGGMTALHAGWLLGAEEVARQKTQNSLNRVLLLSDGNANQGLSDIDDIKSQCAQLADAGVTTSTYGLGHRFNEVLMIGMAGSGLGQGYYGETAEDLADPFREEFELLLNTVANNLHLKVDAPECVEFKLLNNFRQNRDGWSMPDIAAGGEGWALFKLKINQNDIGEKPLEVLLCEICFKDREGNNQKTGPVKLILEPISPNAFETVSEDEKVKSRISEILVATFQRQARDAAQQGDWERVERIIAEAKSAANDDLWMKKSLQSLEKYSRRRQTTQFSKEALYSADRMGKRLIARDEISASYSEDIEAQKAAYLRRKTERGKKM